MEERLQKIIAHAGICSRRQAEVYIAEGRVAVNGKIVTQPGLKVDPAKVEISVDNNQIHREKAVYILLNKPVGYVTTMADPQGRPIVTDLLPDVDNRVFPVGRLDLNSEGALLLTNDGTLANRILHPSYEVNKTYEALVKGTPKFPALRQLEQGIMIDGRKTWPASLRILQKNQGTTLIEIVIHEGKKRQVRKMFQTIGHHVLRLKRTAYGNLKLGSLQPGKHRYLTKNDLKRLFYKKPLYNQKHT
ncbi:MAG: pseudouridine synthase [Desulfobulbus sp.]|nr:MAG: pseudouridine synthase [Desulfobulbus sp.]RUM36740.1 MAG: pseudouridine synthase [Desulfobulbus sp.]